MDFNGSRFHLLQGNRDWQVLLDRQPDSGLRSDPPRSSLTLVARVPRFPSRRSETPPNFSQRRGAGCDRHGNIYWTSLDQRGIRLVPGGTRVAGSFWSVENLRGQCSSQPGAGVRGLCPRPRAPLAQPAGAGGDHS